MRGTSLIMRWKVVGRATQRVIAVTVLLGCLALAPTVSARPPARGFHLTIAITGHGGVRQDAGFVVSGFVVSCPRFDSDSANCPGDERWTVTGNQARVTAVPATGWKLLAWRGACTGTKVTCIVHNRGGRDAHISAIFERASRRRPHEPRGQPGPLRPPSSR